MKCVWLLLGIALVHFAKGQEDVLNFIIIGDWGETLLPGQQRVADRMSEWANDNPLTFIGTAGDNFYPNGANTIDSPQFDNKWKYVYNHTSLADVPWYLSLGNHDYNGDVMAQVNYSEVDDRWNMPWVWHSASFQAGDSSLLLLMIDTEGGFREDFYDPQIMLDWMDEELSSSGADFKIVVGHRQIYSVGDYGPISGTNYDRIRPVLEENNVDFYVCGHDHNLQLLLHMYNEDDVDYIISAGGGALTYPYSEEAEEILATEYNMTKALFERTWGFVSFKASTDQIEVDFWNDEGTLLLNYIRPRKEY